MSKEYNTIINEAITYVQEHLSEKKLDLKAVSIFCGFTPAYFSKVFKTSMGIGIKLYIRDQRIAEAKRLLLETDADNLSIAKRCGFSTVNYFQRVFKEVTGITPGNYRSSKRTT